MLVLEHISKSYIRKKKVFNALQDISLTFEDYSFNFIVCEDKLNSESIFNIMGGLDSFDSGNIVIDGVRYESNSKKFINTYAKDNVGLIFKDYKVFKGINVEENLKIATSIIGERKGISIDEALAKVGLQGYNKKKVSKLTKVEQIKVAIARALVKNPKVLIVNELFENSGDDYSKEILDLLKKLSRERIVIIITKDEKLANVSADRIIKMNSRVVFDNAFSFEEEYIDPTQEQEQNTYVKRTRADAFFSVVRAALQNAKKHWFRVFAVVLLLTITMAAFSFAIILAQYDSTEYAHNYFATTEDQVVVLRPHGKVQKNFDKYASEKLPDYSLEEIYSIAGTDSVVNGGLNNHIFNYAYLYNKMRGENYAYEINADNVAIYSPELEQKFNFKVVAGRYPKNDREIAMTDTLFNIYKAFGYSENKEVLDIKEYKDIIGKDVYGCKVVGVINTGIEPFDTSYAYNLSKKERDEIYKWTDKHYVYANSIHSAFFVTQNCYKRFFTPRSCSYYTSQRFGYSTLANVYYAGDYFGDEVLVGGTRVMEANEVFVGDTIINNLLVAQGYSTTRMSDAEKIQAISNDHIQLLVSFANTENTNSLVQTYDIVGCISGGNSAIVFSDDLSDSFFISKNPESVAVQLKHNDSDLVLSDLFMEYWNDNNNKDYVDVEGQHEEEWARGFLVVETMSYLGAAISLILGILSIVLLVSTCRAIAKDNKSLVLTLKSSGVREQRILDMIYIEMLLIALIAIIGGIGMSFVFGFVSDMIVALHANWMIEGMTALVMGMIALFVLASIGAAYGISRIWYNKTFAIKIDKKW